MSNHFQQRMSWLPQRWRTQRNAIRHANCKIQWVIKTLNASCTSSEVCLLECLFYPHPMLEDKKAKCFWSPQHRRASTVGMETKTMVLLDTFRWKKTGSCLRKQNNRCIHVSVYVSFQAGYENTLLFGGEMFPSWTILVFSPRKKYDVKKTRFGFHQNVFPHSMQFLKMTGRDKFIA